MTKLWKDWKAIMVGLFWACFYLNFLEVSVWLDVRHCPKVQSWAISRKTNDANSKNGEKRHFRHNLVPLGLNSGHHFFLKLWLCQSLDIILGYHHVQYQKKLMTKRTDGRTDGQKDSQKDEINFIWHCPTNVERPIWDLITCRQTDR